MSDPAELKIKLQIYCGPEIAMGPGKADLLDAIQANGSISAPAKVLGMSYRRAWLLVDVMNRCWHSHLVEAVAGGSQERGARVTPFGQEVLRQYRAMASAARDAALANFSTELSRLLAGMPKHSQH